MDILLNSEGTGTYRTNKSALVGRRNSVVSEPKNHQLLVVRI